MNELSRMRASRERLDQQIREAEASAYDDFNDALEAMQDALLEHARQNGTSVNEEERKNAQTVTLDGRVSVEFGYYREWYGSVMGGWLYVSRVDGIRAELYGGLSGRLPSAKVLLALVDLLLELEETPS
jgi:hypothetical protein